jgi:exodeoxyribonuclease VII large subunit
LPAFPRSVGIVTALAGAAVHDMRTVLRTRWPAARIVLRPVRVQGAGSAREIAAAITDLNKLPGIDVMIVGRGGGSLEDLWAFNEEVVARAIVASRVPVVSAVGHEVDFTIADFVADARAPTPTAAAALVVPDRRELTERVARLEAGLRGALARRAAGAREQVDRLARGLGDPKRRVTDLALRIDDLGGRARAALTRRMRWEQRELVTLGERLGRSGPAAGLRRAAERLTTLRERLRFALAVRVRGGRAALEQVGAKLDALSPLACLSRGYAIVFEDGAVVTDATRLVVGAALSIRFARGRARARVEGTEPGDT